MGRVSNAKQQLMEAALELIWSHSYGAVTIDAICEKAGVKKGSFYYFFDSKSSLAAEALQADWEVRKSGFDTIFSSTVPPLNRLRHFFELSYACAAERKCKAGRVLGCPMFTLGSEICTQEQKIRGKISEILDQYELYFESAIRDAHALGIIRAPNAARKAKLLFAYYQGVQTQARIHNDPELLKGLPEGALELLGALSITDAAA